MDKISEGQKVRCPKCGSMNTKTTGFSHSDGVSQPMKRAERVLHECVECKHFFYKTPVMT